MMRAAPCTRSGWAAHYDQQHRRTGSRDAFVLAAWYQLLHLAFGD